VTSQPEPRIEDYLDHVCAPLVGTVPYERRQELRRELREHLMSIAEDGEFDGLSRAEAIEAALRELGEPSETGRDFLEEFTQAEPDATDREARVWSTKLAFGWLGSFTALDLILVDLQVRAEQFPEALSTTSLVCALSPLAAGLLIGLGTPTSPRRGIANAVLLCCLASALYLAIAWPAPQGVAFFVFQLVFWGPVALFAAQPVAALTRRTRSRRFWRRVRSSPPITALT